MTADHKEIRELIALGEDALQEAIEYAPAKSDKYMTVFGFRLKSGEFSDLGNTVHGGADQQNSDAEFIAASYNARPALRELIAENDRLKERMAQDDSIAASAIEFYQKEAAALEKQLAERDALLDEADALLSMVGPDCGAPFENECKQLIEKIQERNDNG